MSPVTDEARLTAEKAGVIAELNALLADRRFASAGRSAGFLRYVVERTLAGRETEIKETVIAAEVYGRPADYDPKTDSIVRVEATRLRQKLRAYYENEGKSAGIRIHLPTGAYVPRFEPITSLPETVPEHTPARAAAKWRWLACVAAAACVLVVLFRFGTMAAAPPAQDPAAVAAWEEGVALLNQDPHAAQMDHGAPPTLLRAIECVEFAVARDPNFARAWATLAEAYDYAYAYVGRDQGEDARRAEAAARRAVALDDRLAAGHHMLGLILWGMRWDFRAAEAAYRRALELDPKNIYAAVEFADLLRETGRSGQAAELIRKSRALLPALPQLAAKEAEIQMDLGYADGAATTANTAIHFNRSFLRAHVILGSAEEMNGDIGAARSRYEYVLSADPFDRRALPAYGYLLARSGQHEAAREIAMRLERINSTIRNCSFQVAVVYAGLQEEDLALDWLERAWRTHQVHLPFVVVEHRFRNLRNHPRFRQIVARVGL